MHALSEGRPARFTAASPEVQDAMLMDWQQSRHGLQRQVFLAVRKLNPSQPAPVLCLIGPPGVGKTSLGRSVARAPMPR